MLARSRSPIKDPPVVWVLADDRPGNTTQSIGLARALSWPYEVKELQFTPRVRLLYRWLGAYVVTRIGLDDARSAPLTPPWPDVVIAAGWRPAPVARWIRKQSRSHTRVVQMGRKGGHVAALFDAVVTPVHCCLPPHPRRIETIAPITPITSERLAQAVEHWQSLFAHAPHPRIALLVGGSTKRYRLETETAQRMGEEVRAFAEAAGGSVFATTSRRTGAEVTEALSKGLGPSSYVHRWQPGQKDNPYLAYLALADVLVVTGESESMLAEAAASGKPIYIYPLPRRPRRPSLKARFKGWVITHAQAHPAENRLQQGVRYLCTQLIAYGIVLPWRDLTVLHQALIRSGIAYPFGAPLE
ncbi:MAG: mitochondrial fission ELM1 family protein, partial [Candidatus Binatia bacterium]